MDGQYEYFYVVDCVFYVLIDIWHYLMVKCDFIWWAA